MYIVTSLLNTKTIQTIPDSLSCYGLWFSTTCKRITFLQHIDIFIQSSFVSIYHMDIYPTIFRIQIYSSIVSLHVLCIYIHTYMCIYIYIYTLILNDRDISIVCNIYTYIYSIYICQYIYIYINIDILSVACFTLGSWLAEAKFFEMRSQGVPENYRTSARRCL